MGTENKDVIGRLGIPQPDTDSGVGRVAVWAIEASQGSNMGWLIPRILSVASRLLDDPAQVARLGLFAEQEGLKNDPTALKILGFLFDRADRERQRVDGMTVEGDGISEQTRALNGAIEGANRGAQVAHKTIAMIEPPQGENTEESAEGLATNRARYIVDAFKKMALEVFIGVSDEEYIINSADYLRENLFNENTINELKTKIKESITNAQEASDTGDNMRIMGRLLRVLSSALREKDDDMLILLVFANMMNVHNKKFKNLVQGLLGEGYTKSVLSITVDSIKRMNTEISTRVKETSVNIRYPNLVALDAGGINEPLYGGRIAMHTVTDLLVFLQSDDVIFELDEYFKQLGVSEAE